MTTLHTHQAMGMRHGIDRRVNIPLLPLPPPPYPLTPPPRPHGASGFPPRPVDFPGEMRGERHLVPSDAVGRPDNELLGDDRQELRAESTVFPVELRVWEAGANDRCPLAAGSRCFVSAIVVRLAAGGTKTWAVGSGSDIWTHRRQTSNLGVSCLASPVTLEVCKVEVHIDFASFSAPCRQPRAQQATAPIIGAIVYLPANEEIASQGAFAGESHNKVCPSSTHKLSLGDLFFSPFLCSCVYVRVFQGRCDGGRCVSPPFLPLTPPSAGPAGFLSSPPTSTADGSLTLQFFIDCDATRTNGTGVDNESREEDFPEGETYLLLLAACEGEEREAAEAGGYQLPLSCEVDSCLAVLLVSCRSPSSPHGCDLCCG